MRVKEIVKITRGKLLSGDPERDIDPAKISTDSRTIHKGEFFIALSGANFDGNCFVKEAFRKGACGALSTIHYPLSTDSSKIHIRVKDTIKALQAIAAYHRKKFRIPVVCITGSNGKTTVKDMAWHLLSSKYNVLRNEGTRNNHIGVPQALLKLNSSHQICVLELGTNHKGEITLLS
ncbi:MAG: Mur ligase family protein, partial [Candidatus Omnitrophota bacterium]|nr:Mur ligase family protein [Candidatus Omnitrophota bacterium]